MSNGLPPDPAAGVFETLLVLDGAPVELDAHLQRIEHSVRELYGARLPAAARGLVLEHARPLELGRLRITLAPAAAGEPSQQVASAAVERAAVFPSWERALELRTFPAEGGLGPHKWADREWLAAREAEIGERCLPLLLDAGAALEASRANLFAVEQGVLVTPPLDGRILPGVARSRAIELARSLGIEVLERELPLERLLAAEEAFLTGSVRGIEPVRALDGSPLPGPGEATRRIAAAMERLWLGAGG